MIDTHNMDLVTMNIMENSMISTCREMGITLMKTSYSTIFNEALDFTCAIASPKGEMLAVAEFCPAQIGGMPLLIRSCLQEIPRKRSSRETSWCITTPIGAGCTHPSIRSFARSTLTMN